MFGIIDAVSYIHERGIVHRDLKTANILFDEETGETSVKIIDFGFGDKQMSNTGYDDHVGTLTYMAPEVAFNHEYTKSVDIWAIGIIMHILLTGGKHPFFDREKDNAITFKKKLGAMKVVKPSDELSWLAQNLFQRLTTIQAHQRYTAKDALRHPWITRRHFDQIP